MKPLSRLFSGLAIAALALAAAVALLFFWNPIQLSAQLAFKNIASPEVDAAKDIQQGNERCYSVSGIFTSFPGVSEGGDESYCLSHEVRFKGTSDMIAGQWHENLCIAASAYALRYNRYVIQYRVRSSATQKADFVRVQKSDGTLYLMNKGQAFASFHVALGRGGHGPKQQEGDGRTPEGRYVLDSKKEDSAFYKAIHISYPSAEDQKRASSLGVKPGGSVMIHGQKNGLGWLAPLTQRFDWTNGCIALSDNDMAIIWDTVDVGTPIEIVP